MVVVAPVQAVIGDFHGLNTLEHQPAKVAAMEGHWGGEEAADGEGLPLILFGWPDMEEERTRFAVSVPHLGSLILTHSWDGTIPGLKEFAPEDRPNVPIVFWSFRIMVGLGMLMILLGGLSLMQRWRGRLYNSRWFLRFALLMGPAGLIAILAGWYTTEVGRQPWVVYGLMRTEDAVSTHSATTLGVSLALFVVVYLFVFGAGVAYTLRLVRKGPQLEEGTRETSGGPGRPRHAMRPLSAVEEDLDDDQDTDGGR